MARSAVVAPAMVEAGFLSLKKGFVPVFGIQASKDEPAGSEQWERIPNPLAGLTPVFREKDGVRKALKSSQLPRVEPAKSPSLVRSNLTHLGVREVHGTSIGLHDRPIYE